MIEIITNGKKLELYDSTTLNIENNNALFASPDIEGDFSYSFEIPVDGNEIAIDFSHLPWKKGVCHTDCIVTVAGAFSLHGTLMLQKTNKDTVTAAIIISPYPDGFGERSMTKNTDESIVISQSLEAHKADWVSFLLSTITPEADIKFAPFINEDGYGSENEDYGFWKGRAVTKTVNPLYTDENGDAIESTDILFAQVNGKSFRLYDENSDQYVERNQLAYCPQLRLSRILDLWCRNAGYRFVNHIGEDLQGTFIQTTRSLDGTGAQYLGTSDGLSIKTNASICIQGNVNGYPTGRYYCNSFSYQGHSQDQYVHNGAVYLPTNGWWRLTLKISDVEYPSNYIALFEKKWSRWVMLAGAFLTGGGTLPVGGADLTALIVAKLGSTAHDFAQSKLYFRIYTGTHNIREIDEDGAGVVFAHDFRAAEAVCDINRCMDIRISDAHTDTALNFILYVKSDHGQYMLLDNARMDMLFTLTGEESQPGGMNIFRKSFSIPEVCPDITNSAFIKAIIDTFGMCYYVSNTTNEIEMVPYSLIRDSLSIDLTEYEIVGETEKNEPKKPRREFRLKPLTDEEYQDSLRLEDTDTDLPDPYENYERYILVKSTNTLYGSKTEEDDVNVWKAEWKEVSGNPDSLIVEGEDKGNEKTEPGVRIPHQRRVSGGDESLSRMMQVANFTIGSDMFNPNERGSDLIITQHRGLSEFNYIRNTDNNIYMALDLDSQTWVRISESDLNEHPEHYGASYMLEDTVETVKGKADLMLPVSGNGFALTSKGENSLGEKYKKPVLELQNQTEFTYKFRIPCETIQKIDSLIRPQHSSPQNQVRFFTVRNVKCVPKKIQFQIDHSDTSGTVLCQIEAVRAC